jgi:hypothetical protein
MSKLTLKERKEVWKLRNRGTLADIAGKAGCSRAHVSDVFHLRRTNAKVAGLLAKAGAPGFNG